MSLIKSILHQLGLSSDPTKNFTIGVPAVPDGTMKLARGNAGATTQDIMTVDAAGKVNFPVKATGRGTVLAACAFDGTLIGTNAPLSGFGITSVTRNSAGNYTITLDASYPNNNFIVALAVDNGAFNSLFWDSSTVNSVTVINYVAGVQTNATRCFVTITRAD